MWQKKSRVLWLKEGDNNTKFFRKIANARSSINGIHNLLIKDERVEDATTIKCHVEEFFF